MNDNSVLPEEMKMASTVASSFASKWKLVEKDDLESQLFLWLVQNTRHLIKWREEEGDGKLYVSLRREAAKYCRQETRHRANLDDINNNNFYNTDIIYNALPYIFEYDITQADVNGDDSGLAYNIMTDIINAYNGLNKENKEILELRYKLGYSFTQIANSLDVTPKAVEKRVERAVTRLLDSLSGSPIAWIKTDSKHIAPDY